MTSKRVLVTGGSGFIAGHCILQLLDAGYHVRTTVRDLTKEPAARAVLQDAGMPRDAPLEFVAADLLDEAGWPEAVADVDAVLHVASPVAPGHVANEADVIVPAREGTLRVLRAAVDAGVPRVVLTSAFHAVGWGHPHDDHIFTEDDWSVLDGPGSDAYARSKTLAEQAAWDYVGSSGGSTELVALLPVAVMGPVMGRSVSGANHVIQNLLAGEIPVLPRLFFPIVDVRDVAAAHVLAVRVPEAGGQRFLLSNGPALELRDVAGILRRELGPAAARVPRLAVPDAIVRAGARFNPQFREIVPDLNYARRTSNAKAREVLGWAPRNPAEAVVAAGESLVAKGLVTEPEPRLRRRS